MQQGQTFHRVLSFSWTYAIHIVHMYTPGRNMTQGTEGYKNSDLFLTCGREDRKQGSLLVYLRNIANLFLFLLFFFASMCQAD